MYYNRFLLDRFLEEFVVLGAGDIYKERDQLKFKYRNQQIARSLKGCDHDTAQKAIKRINEKIDQALSSY